MRYEFSLVSALAGGPARAVRAVRAARAAARERAWALAGDAVYLHSPDAVNEQVATINCSGCAPAQRT